MSICASLGRTMLNGVSLLLAGAMGCATASCDVGTPFKSEQKLELTVTQDVSVFNLNNVVGDIEIKTDAAASGVTASVVKIGKGSTQGEADAALGEISVTLAPGAVAGTIEAITTQPKSANNRGYNVNWVVTLPPTAQLVITNRVGDVTVLGGNKGVQITNDVGDIAARNASGGLTLTTRVGDVAAHGSGEIVAKADVGDVSVRLSGPGESIKANARVGDVTVFVPRDWTGRATTTNNVGDLEFDNDALSISSLTKSRGRAEATLNGGGTGVLEAGTQVGDVTVRHGG